MPAAILGSKELGHLGVVNLPRKLPRLLENLCAIFRISMAAQVGPFIEETIALGIDDSGESWVAAGKPVAGDDVMVKITSLTRGEPFEVELPFVTSAK